MTQSGPDSGRGALLRRTLLLALWAGLILGGLDVARILTRGDLVPTHIHYLVLALNMVQALVAGLLLFLLLGYLPRRGLVRFAAELVQLPFPAPGPRRRVRSWSCCWRGSPGRWPGWPRRGVWPKSFPRQRKSRQPPGHFPPARSQRDRPGDGHRACRSPLALRLPAAHLAEPRASGSGVSGLPQRHQLGALDRPLPRHACSPASTLTTTGRGAFCRRTSAGGAGAMFSRSTRSGPLLPACSAGRATSPPGWSPTPTSRPTRA